MLATPAISPPKNTHGSVDWPVEASTCGRPHELKPIGESASITVHNKNMQIWSAVKYSDYSKTAVLGKRFQLSFSRDFNAKSNLKEKDQKS